MLDYLAVGVAAFFILLAVIMFVVIRSQSRKSEHPEGQLSNASNPTLLQHAPPDSQSAYSVSMLSLVKPGTPDPNAASKENLADEGRKFKRRLFFEDTAEDDAVVERRGSGVV